jgi:hypothetical protein
MDGIHVVMEKNVKIITAMPLILSNEKRNVERVMIAKGVTVDSYILIHSPRNVLCVQRANNGIVQRCIQVLELGYVLIKKTVRI